MSDNATASVQLVIGVSTGGHNVARRNSLRRSWFQYKTGVGGPLSQQQKDSFLITFIGAQDSTTLQHEQDKHHDITLVNAPEGYENLWRKVLTFFQWAEDHLQYDFMMHCDDDSFVRLDLLLPLVEAAPRQRYYWGYIWNGGEARTTVPIRETKYKSHMPVHQYPHDYYPPFASGCGFILSRDLVRALLAQPLPEYRLLDPPFGIHLCGTDRCIIEPPITPVHHPCVRPYRPLPLFRKDTIIQHYMQPEEMRPFYTQALEAAEKMEIKQVAGDAHAACTPASAASSSSTAHQQQSAEDTSPAHELYDTLVQLGIWRR